jgi:hypothetical protein
MHSFFETAAPPSPSTGASGCASDESTRASGGAGESARASGISTTSPGLGKSMSALHAASATSGATTTKEDAAAETRVRARRDKEALMRDFIAKAHARTSDRRKIPRESRSQAHRCLVVARMSTDEVTRRAARSSFSRGGSPW